MIYSLEIERHVLGGILKHPDVFPEIQRFITENDFYNEVNRTVFCVMRDLLSNGKTIDKVILAQSIKNLGVHFNEDINIFDYIENISFTQINRKGAVESTKELLKLRVRREIYGVAKDVGVYVKKTNEPDLDKIISETDALYNSKIRSYDFEDEPTDVFDGLYDMIEERGESPNEDVGIETAYKDFNEMFGGLRPKNIYAVVARPGQGKSTFLSDMAYGVCQKNNIKCLYLDTEMSTEEQQFRLAAAVSGVPLWYIETGNWRRNREFVEKIRNSLSSIKKSGLYHIHAGNKNVDQICSLVRRWYFKNVKRGNKCAIFYDYVKLTGENVGQNWAEHQAIGDKIDKLKKLAEELDCPVFTAMQMNRTGENHNRTSGQMTDDSSAIALSDRLQWFASFVAIFRRKTLDEMEEDGDFGTHKLIPLKTRWQGREAAGHHDRVRRTFADGRQAWVNNYLNYNVQNFSVEERGSLEDIIEAQQEIHEVEGENNNDGDLL
jgi:replicative DNA helicase|tara:strand:+ start:62 stop:1537 length:1476 start_codon:yes stop_codon:yes gene_type:complete